MISRLGYVVLAAGLAQWAASPSFATEPLSFGVLTAVPYGMELPDKSVTGSNHDIGALIAEKAGLTFTYRLQPLTRLISDMKVGKLDLMIMIPVEDTKQFSIAELAPNNTVILPKLGTSFRDFADLKGKTIAHMRGGHYDDRVTFDEDIKKYDVDNYAIGLRMTKGGRVDGTIGPDFGLYYQVMLEGMKRDDFGPPLVLNTRWLTLLASKSVDPEVVAKLKTAVQELRQNGAIAAVAAKYLE
jgi:ABC-type amino acid transport substrate-binding protein